jgi:transcriptional antiterminator
MMKTKLHHCTTRTLPRDLEDLQFLLTNYGDEVAAVADQLDDDDKEFFLDLDFVKMQSLELQARFRALLGLGADVE